MYNTVMCCAVGRSTSPAPGSGLDHNYTRIPTKGSVAPTTAKGKENRSTLEDELTLKGKALSTPTAPTESVRKQVN